MTRHRVPAACVHDVFLSLVQLPSGRQASDILRRIGVPDHHFLPSVDTSAIHVECEQPIEDLGRAPQVRCRLEQRHHAKESRNSGLLLQQHHSKNVRGLLRHRDHIRAKRLVMDVRERVECVEHVPHLR